MIEEKKKFSWIPGAIIIGFLVLVAVLFVR
ncbi:hypothetical protein AAA799E16_00066 [Marine Group I thaumarchaeote SCGC AAA799-E16]|uniref:Uncharacterized protein n=5 Tax=Marine Group I TaxID=905826 RepID=A0A087S757_9ARCH|nr:hypothetical protein AAA799E16_00066 [Marine Group I thaumarchaeote SCGC AAA799-E16]KFM17339.1 hypothetical protein AAA799D11_00136 [Marine Group I thaumarchaeote SCGC AAA799-D11]KFM18762.1 hypothetical protein AAA799P11_00971 [Marine Group I thaumarchaeote SCGC AAA799-P11]KFM19359.1 hypothetical protein SCCGRSA3_00507 [Marine Group I thaumarchaeote SCGC RSA3]KFM21561.1 hypothetical protein AAA799B03_00813 [Marine Group I thaumarchaeote SCGC AAA799-B03]